MNAVDDVVLEETPVKEAVVEDVVEFDPLVTDEEAEEYDEEADSLGEQEMDPEFEAELEVFFQEPSTEAQKIAAQRDANMFQQQVFEAQVREFTKTGNKEELTALAKILGHMKETYGVTPAETPKRVKLNFIESELARCADELVVLRVRADTFKFMDNQQVLENVVTAITNIRGGVRKLLALKYKLAPRSKNEAVPEALEERRV
jgi:hypothetical protein